jgi:hypothetical protein
MDNNFAEFLTTGGWNTPTHILERRLILSVVKVLCTGCTHSLHPHCTHRVENAKGKGCTCTRCTRGSGIPDSNLSQEQPTLCFDERPPMAFTSFHHLAGLEFFNFSIDLI